MLDVHGDDVRELRSAVDVVSPNAVENLLSRHALGMGGEVFVDSFLDRLVAKQALGRDDLLAAWAVQEYLHCIDPLG
jgi:hypothetical protein